MAFLKDRILIHFNTSYIKVYEFTNKILQTKYEMNRMISVEGLKSGIFTQIDEFFHELKEYTNSINNEYVRLYATGVYQTLDSKSAIQLINHIFIYYGLYFNIVQPDLEKFYLEQSMKIYGSPSLVEGIISQEFRNVVVCGSFKHSIKEIEDTIKILKNQNITVLSPTTTKLRPETLGSNFVLFEGQELMNERDAWRHQYWHISQFSASDAVIICAPNGKVGNGALFELGYLVAISKRIIFTEKPQNLSVIFPYEVGLDF